MLFKRRKDMLLLADSGSTKVDWCYIDKEFNKKEFQSLGMNPYNVSKEFLHKQVEDNVVKNLNPDDVQLLYFYGSGCSTPQKKNEMKEVFKQYFPNTDIHIEDDLLAAARAACGHQKGIAAILGTGSNSCLYDGENIVENLPSLGYVLCDEGAGTNIGKLVLKTFLRHQMPKQLDEEFSNLYPGQEADFLNKLYQGQAPNFFLASFAKFAIQRQDNEYCRDLIKEAFNDFFSKQVTQYTDYELLPISVVGSVGYYAQEVFKEVAKQYNVKVNKIIKAPMEQLIEYHLSLLT